MLFGGNSSRKPLYSYPAALIFAMTSLTTVVVFGSPMSQPVKPIVFAFGSAVFVYVNRPGMGSSGVIARVPQK